MSEAPWRPFVSPSVDVEVTDLNQFAALLAEDVMYFLVSRASGIDGLLTDDPPFEGGGLSEGTTFHGAYLSLKSALGQLLADAYTGVQTLSGAAATIAADYATEDAMSASTVESVLGRHDG